MGSLVMTTKRVVEERRVEISVVKAVGEQEEPTTQDKKAVVEVAAVVEKGGEQPPQVVGVQLPSRASRKEAQDKKPEEVTEETGRKEGKEKIMGEEGQENRKRGRKKGQKRRKVVGGGGGEGAYKRYVYRVLKQVHPELSVSSKAMAVLEGLMKDMFERLVEEAARLCKYSGKATLSSRDIQGAVRLVLPGELGKHAVAEGTKAVVKYMDAD